MFANAVPNHTLLLFDGADHNFKGKYRELVQAVIEFFARHDQGGYSKALGMRLNAGIVIPRWVDVEGVRNLRDIGGWPLKDGSGYVRERTVFRSAQ
jgi:hypothetical protein